MTTDREKVRLIFGFKLKQLRQERGLSTYDLADKTGLSPSYLNEIEKGKKYPKTEKIFAIAKALDTDYDALVSLKVSKQLEAVAELLNSNILNELPLELFGIEPGYFLEMMAAAPAKLSAFINTLIEIGRNYDLRVEQFYYSVLRTYQAMHDSYFEEIEAQSDQFLDKHPLPSSPADSSAFLTQVLTAEFGCAVEPYDQTSQPALLTLRSVFIPERNKLLINSKLSFQQTAFTLGREVGYRQLSLVQRPLESSMLTAASFEEVLNNFRASYFARAMLMPRARFLPLLTDALAQLTWQPDRMLAIMASFAVTPEMFLSRVMNLIASYFGLNDLFFIRFNQPTDQQRFVISKELHLSRLHAPHGVARDEHYCRRQVALTMLNDMRTEQAAGSWHGQPFCQAQITTYVPNGQAYFVLSMAKSSPPSTTNSSINLGLPLTADLRRVIAFLDDPAIPRTDVGDTCERCPITDCTVRAAPATVLAKQEQVAGVKAAIAGLRGE